MLDKLLRFHVEHGTAAEAMLADLRAAAGQLPGKERAAEAAPLAEQLADLHAHRRRGPQVLGQILPLVLAELGWGKVESSGSGAAGPA